MVMNGMAMSGMERSGMRAGTRKPGMKRAGMLGIRLGLRLQVGTPANLDGVALHGHLTAGLVPGPGIRGRMTRGQMHGLGQVEARATTSGVAAKVAEERETGVQSRVMPSMFLRRQPGTVEMSGTRMLQKARRSRRERASRDPAGISRDHPKSQKPALGKTSQRMAATPCSTFSRALTTERRRRARARARAKAVRAAWEV
mmetsp:Transcript_44923/g.80794  ORF Transcript_44923/g.80794 Transcript_44923/m.80794 type:complete len:200 (-) Transcript_44923:54-653(-)